MDKLSLPSGIPQNLYLAAHRARPVRCLLHRMACIERRPSVHRLDTCVAGNVREGCSRRSAASNPVSGSVQALRESVPPAGEHQLQRFVSS